MKKIKSNELITESKETQKTTEDHKVHGIMGNK